MAHVARLRAQGVAGIRRLAHRSACRPLPGRLLRAGIGDLRQALGFNLGSETARLNGIERARDSGRVVLVGGVRLRRDPRAPQRLAVALLMPVYGASLPLGRSERRRSALLGFVYAPFRLPDVLAAIAQRQPAPRFSLREGGRTAPCCTWTRDPTASAAAALYRRARGDRRWPGLEPRVRGRTVEPRVDREGAVGPCSVRSARAQRCPGDAVVRPAACPQPCRGARRRTGSGAAALGRRVPGRCRVGPRRHRHDRRAGMPDLRQRRRRADADRVA